MNLQKMMKQAQEMQKKMEEAQARAEETETEGSSGAGMVVVKVNGRGTMLGIAIDASLMKLEEKDMLEDLIIAAFNDAKKKSDEAFADSMSDITSGMQLPPGMKLPFGN